MIMTCRTCATCLVTYIIMTCHTCNIYYYDMSHMSHNELPLAQKPFSPDARAGLAALDASLAAADGRGMESSHLLK